MSAEKESFEGPGFDCRVDEFSAGLERNARKTPPGSGGHDGGGVYVSEEPERVRRRKRTPRRYTGMPGTVQCTARAKWRMRETPWDPRCRNEAVPGKDKCPYHGGLTPFQHGLRSKYAPEGIPEMVEEVRRNPAILKLEEEIATLVVLTNMAMEKAAEEGFSTKTVNALVRLLSKSSDAKYKRGMLLQGASLPVDSFVQLQEDFIRVVEEEVEDLSTKQQIRDRLLELYGRRGR